MKSRGGSPRIGGVVNATLVATMVLAGVPRPAVAADEAWYALVIGNNQGVRDGQDLLRYADDDAALWWGLLGEAGADVRLLSVLDADTRASRQEVSLP